MQEPDIELDPEDVITPQELAELIKGVPDPLTDSKKLMMADDPEKATRAYVQNIKERPGGVILKLSNISRHASHIETCADCRQHVSGGSISLIRAENSDDVDFGPEAGYKIGFLNVTVRPDSQLQGKVHRVELTPMAVHQLGSHKNYDSSRYQGGGKIDPKQVLDVVKSPVLKPAAQNTPIPQARPASGTK